MSLITGNEKFFDCIEFAENPEPRCPCLLLLDTSSSMAGPAIDLLNNALQQFKDELSRDKLASKRVEIATVSFGPVSIRHDFVTIDNYIPEYLQAEGSTPMGEAILCGIDLVEKRKAVYRQNGVSYYRPWIFLITDGEPTDDWDIAEQKIQEGEMGKKFSFFAVGVEDANMQILAKLSYRKPLKLKGLMFAELFQWLSSSLGSVSRSQPGQGKTSLQIPYGDKGWAEIEV